MGDRSIAVLYEEKHLAGPRFRRQGPAVAKYNRLSGAPILVVDISSVLCHDSAHCGISFCASCNREESTRRSKKVRVFERWWTARRQRHLRAIPGRTQE